jgi:hypothetical protein
MANKKLRHYLRDVQDHLLLADGRRLERGGHASARPPRLNVADPHGQLAAIP